MGSLQGPVRQARQSIESPELDNKDAQIGESNQAALDQQRISNNNA
jgi:hypothetical protein